MTILAFDPSGNFKEGKGTTGWAFGGGQVGEVGEIKAKEFSCAEEYWQDHIHLILQLHPDEMVMEGYKLYNHAGQEANKQSNSELETPQLIGCIKLLCYQYDIPLKVQWASQAKGRWTDKVLKAKGILTSDNRLAYNGQKTNAHKRDAIRHWMHYYRYGRGKS